MRAFFADIYGFDAIEQGLVRKDPALFPAFSQPLIQDAREQTLRVIADHLLDDDGDYRELFTTRRSFMTRTLGLVYRVPVRSRRRLGAVRLFPADSQRAGLLTHVSLLALHSHPGRSSPTLRGKFVREVLLCQDVPPPPGNIDFSMFADDAAQNRSTARERLEAHVASPACAGCHDLMDPLGLALEKMDGIGVERDDRERRSRSTRRASSTARRSTTRRASARRWRAHPRLVAVPRRQPVQVRASAAIRSPASASCSRGCRSASPRRATACASCCARSRSATRSAPRPARARRARLQRPPRTDCCDAQSGGAS